MLNIGNARVPFCDGVTRRSFIQVGGLGSLGLSLNELLALQKASASGNREKNCILLFMVGGPSQLETWDPKPDAPSEIRGPFGAIRTNVPGVEINEYFPRMARMADKYAILRSVYHDESPIHETGHQMMQTGTLFRQGAEYPHYGSMVAMLKGARYGMPPYVVVPKRIGNTGVSISHGQGAGYLGQQFAPLYYDDLQRCHPSSFPILEGSRLELNGKLSEAIDSLDQRVDEQVVNTSEHPAWNRILSRGAKKAFQFHMENEAVRNRYGRGTFGQSCLLARRLVQSGVRLVTVNMFDTVFNRVTWDCHANGGSLGVTLEDYKQTLSPMFDQAYTALISDLDSRGLLEDTLVVAMGEFGRTYKVNSRGGRDHWTQVWSVLFAGGGVQGGQVIGASDKNAAAPKDRPIHPSEIAASIYHAIGINPSAQLPGPEQKAVQVAAATPVKEIFSV